MYIDVYGVHTERKKKNKNIGAPEPWKEFATVRRDWWRDQQAFGWLPRYLGTAQTGR
jgi:hypothetical protein